METVAPELRSMAPPYAMENESTMLLARIATLPPMAKMAAPICPQVEPLMIEPLCTWREPALIENAPPYPAEEAKDTTLLVKVT
mmetsp:Transcript_14949/g.44777  ORF Transcript_14949/g.44777 Transcript_14949/m.44777 type:complete len:84 (+) Transcript_14949:223-474(+)